MPARTSFIFLPSPESAAQQPKRVHCMPRESDDYSRLTTLQLATVRNPEPLLLRQLLVCTEVHQSAVGLLANTVVVQLDQAAQCFHTVQVHNDLLVSLWFAYTAIAHTDTHVSARHTTLHAATTLATNR